MNTPELKTTPPLIRAGTEADIPAIHAVHVASIRGLCATAYSPELIEAWSSNRDLVRYTRMFKPECRCLVAVADDRICGFGSVELAKSRLASLFVHPEYAGIGVGKLLLRQLEALASNAGIGVLYVQASLNAREFYAHYGYRLQRMGKHCSSTGLEMDCADMEKTF